MRRKKWVTFIIAMFCASGVVYAAKKKTPPGQSMGTYVVWAAGYYTGKGTVVVKHKKLSIDLPLDSDDGEATLTASNIHITGDNHFTGNATLGGTNVSLNGRLDIPDGTGEEVETARVQCTLECEDGHRGRFVGYLDTSTP